MDKYDEKVVNIRAMTLNTSQTESESSLLMSPFQNVSKSELSDIIGDVGISDLFSPRAIKAMNDIALFPKSKATHFHEDDKENVISERPSIDSCTSSFYSCFSMIIES